MTRPGSAARVAGMLFRNLLIALMGAALAAVLLTATDKRGCYSLRSLLVIITLVAVLFGAFALVDGQWHPD